MTLAVAARQDHWELLQVCVQADPRVWWRCPPPSHRVQVVATGVRHPAEFLAL